MRSPAAPKLKIDPFWPEGSIEFPRRWLDLDEFDRAEILSDWIMILADAHKDAVGQIRKFLKAAVKEAKKTKKKEAGNHFMNRRSFLSFLAIAPIAVPAAVAAIHDPEIIVGIDGGAVGAGGSGLAMAAVASRGVSAEGMKAICARASQQSIEQALRTFARLQHLRPGYFGGGHA